MVNIKADNILVNWTCDKEGTKTITNVALGDFDIASKLETGALLHTTHAVGNAMWRSPEGQTGRGLSKASDVYSFGLVVSYCVPFSWVSSKKPTLSVRAVHIYPWCW
jgi:serine/threonine protein kinase